MLLISQDGEQGGRDAVALGPTLEASGAVGACCGVQAGRIIDFACI